MTNEHANLFAAIVKVMADVRSLPKNGHNKQNSYDYVTSDDALESIGKAMAKHGVVVIPSMTNYETMTDGKMTRAKASFDMHICGTDGAVFTSPWIAEGIDYGNPDKALTKAMTYATKTFLLKLFVVGAGGDDPDGESAVAEKTTEKPTQKPKKATTEPTKLPKDNQIPAPVAEWLNDENAAQAAKDWAVGNGAQPNEHAARNSLKKIVNEQFGGKFTKENQVDVLTVFYFRQHEHLAELANTATAEPEPLAA